jgi:hypothetical protein
MRIDHFQFRKKAVGVPAAAVLLHNPLKHKCEILGLESIVSSRDLVCRNSGEAAHLRGLSSCWHSVEWSFQCELLERLVSKVDCELGVGGLVERDVLLKKRREIGAGKR